MAGVTPQKDFTPAQVAERFQLKKVDTVYRLINRGLLRAFNLSPGAARPTWRITAEALDQFIAARTATPTPVATAGCKRTKARVTRYF